MDKIITNVGPVSAWVEYIVRPVSAISQSLFMHVSNDRLVSGRILWLFTKYGS